MNMIKKYWYEKIAQKILGANTDVLFIVDKLDILDYSELKERLSPKYTYIVHYESEIGLRRLLKKRNENLLALFKSEKDIPYHMLSKFAVLSLDTDIIFPLLDKETISKIPLCNFHLLYDFYMENIKGRQYERLSKKDTEDIIRKSISAKDGIQINRMLDLETRIIKLLNIVIGEKLDKKSSFTA